MLSKKNFHHQKGDIVSLAKQRPLGFNVLKQFVLLHKVSNATFSDFVIG